MVFSKSFPFVIDGTIAGQLVRERLQQPHWLHCMPVDCLSRRSFQTIIITMQSELTGENSPEDRLWARTSDTGVAEIEPEIQEHRVSLRDYLASYEFLEFLACVGFVIPAVFLEFAPPDPRQRAIPFQILENSGDYVVNQVYNETFSGETFSSTYLFTIATTNKPPSSLLYSQRKNLCCMESLSLS